MRTYLTLTTTPLLATQNLRGSSLSSFLTKYFQRESTGPSTPCSLSLENTTILSWHHFSIPKTSLCSWWCLCCNEWYQTYDTVASKNFETHWDRERWQQTTSPVLQAAGTTRLSVCRNHHDQREFIQKLPCTQELDFLNLIIRVNHTQRPKFVLIPAQR